ncbi:MAG: hypothetical protein DRI46_11205, partial [Chloroflexi bacterium]
NLESHLSLKDIGVDTQHPIWNRELFIPRARFDPLDYQIETGAYVTSYDNSWVLSSMGSGKTISCIWAAEFLKTMGEISNVLIICPLSTVQHVWVRELFQSYPALSVGVVTGNKKQKLAVLQRTCDYYIVNHDGVRQKYILEELKKICPDLIILDEATAMKNGSTSRYESLEELYKHCGPRVWALTGTPAAHAPTDIYAMQKIIDPSTVPSSLTRWKYDTMFQITQHMWKPKPNSDVTVEAALQPAIRFTRADIPTLGTPIQLHAELTDEQRKVFAAIKNEMMVEIAQKGKDHTILAVNAAVMLSKLLQVCSGNVYDINRDTVMLANKARLDALTGVLEEGGVARDTKALIFIPFKSSQHQIMKHLNDKGIKSELVNGDVSSTKRADIFKRFEDEEGTRALCLHPRVASHGLTLIAASITVWYGPQFSTETYLQANARTARIGQKQALSLVHITSHAIEREVFNNLQDKKDNQDAILKLFDQVIDMDD